MSTTPSAPRVTPYWWNRLQVDAEPGALITTRGRSLFIPADQLRAIADGLHDIADDLEATP
ncbi:hypothetical protein [Brachybacterium squillarum]|uniref:hypothetical protein n=1 Tax=Brachybacterium squillarum TaxID=661979 RepID=UPI0002629A3E|nr:hypothetical protein [Brachybacterium squillarum]